MIPTLTSNQVLAPPKHQEAPAIIGYAVSFIKCGLKETQTKSAGLIDASLVVRHTIHQNLIWNNQSKYDYAMYALVHTQVVQCLQQLSKLGFEVIVVEPPVKQKEITGSAYLRKTIHKEWCCGADEFIKLYAYDKIPHYIVVHVDIDFAFFKPMDNLFDAVLYDKDSPQGQTACANLHRERPEDPWPGDKRVFLTRDWLLVHPNKFPPGYQAGFLVAKHDPSIVSELAKIIPTADLVAGVARAMVGLLVPVSCKGS